MGVRKETAVEMVARGRLLAAAQAPCHHRFHRPEIYRPYTRKGVPKHVQARGRHNNNYNNNKNNKSRTISVHGRGRVMALPRRAGRGRRRAAKASRLSRMRLRQGGSLWNADHRRFT